LRHVERYYVTLLINRELVSKANLSLVSGFTDIVNDCPKIFLRSFENVSPGFYVIPATCVWMTAPAAVPKSILKKHADNSASSHVTQRHTSKTTDHPGVTGDVGGLAGAMARAGSVSSASLRDSLELTKSQRHQTAIEPAEVSEYSRMRCAVPLRNSFFLTTNRQFDVYSKDGWSVQ